jgi:large conductance mechanosensitive channel
MADRPSIGGFRAFLTKTNALALAVGVIIGGATSVLINSLVNDVIMPPIGWALGGVDFAAMKIVLGTSASGEEVAINYGLFINALISFVVLLFVVYMLATWFIREAPAAPTKECPFCKEANAEAATKCRACASAI